MDGRLKQVVQNLRTGRVEVLSVPTPVIEPTEVLVGVRASVISPGTERAKVITARKSLVSKARSRPDQVKQVIEKAHRDGLRAAVEVVRYRLNAPAALGYSAAGVVLEVGDRVSGIRPGDRVACAGAEYAVHAEIIRVPGTLCVRVPDGVAFDHAAFSTLGAIAMHGVRQTEAHLGERVAVVGMGLVGQLAGQLLRAAGCTVIAIDLAQGLLDLARSSGAADEAILRGSLAGDVPDFATGCDAVLITAASLTNDPVELATRLARDRGRIVVVGDVRLDVPRAAFYEKELELRLSRSYGPGRYDRDYEERGLDYPIGYVRWTERRNMEAFVELTAAGKLDLERLISKRVAVEDAASVYEELAEGQRSPLGVIIQYGGTGRGASSEHPVVSPSRAPKADPLAVGVIGAGSFAQRVLIPSLRDAGFRLHSVASAGGLSATSAVERFGFAQAVAPDALLAEPAIGLVVVATRHGSHATLAAAALRAGKAVFVEKPPSTTLIGLAELRDARNESGLPLVVGFNRRYAPLALEFRRHVRDIPGPIELLYRVNAGPLPDDHWLYDPGDGGGRLVGEGCHFVDFICWVVGALPTSVSAVVQPRPGQTLASAQAFTIGLEFEDGSLGTILYQGNGAVALPKEYAEAHGGGRSALLRDFGALELIDGRRRRRLRNRRGDKGYRAQFERLRRLLAAETDEDRPDPLDTMAATLWALRAAESEGSVRLPTSDNRWS